MQIEFNGEQREIPDGSSLAGLCLDVGPGMAVAVNEHVIARSAWPAHELQEGDRVLLLQAVQGG